METAVCLKPPTLPREEQGACRVLGAGKRRDVTGVQHTCGHTGGPAAREVATTARVTSRSLAPVKPEVAGSSPVTPATMAARCWGGRPLPSLHRSVLSLGEAGRDFALMGRQPATRVVDEQERRSAEALDPV